MEARQQLRHDFQLKFHFVRFVNIRCQLKRIEPVRWFKGWVAEIVEWDEIILIPTFISLAANQTVVVTYVNESFDIPANFSYHCNREQTLNATSGTLVVSKVQFEAFKRDNSEKFSVAKDCDSHITPDIIPIAVGIALISLIVVVLIAYIVGRRRQQARGYLNIM